MEMLCCTAIRNRHKKLKTYCKRLVDKLFGFSKSGKLKIAPNNKSKGGFVPCKGRRLLFLIWAKGFTRTY